MTSIQGHAGLLLSSSIVSWNPADTSVNIVLSNGNLTATKINTNSHDGSFRANIGKSSGKWYWETLIVNNSIGTAEEYAAFANILASLSTFIGGDANGWCYLNANGLKYTNGTGVAFGTSYGTNGTVLNIALDMTAGYAWFGLNGIYQASGNPSAGTNPAFSGLTGTIYPAGGMYDISASMTGRFKLSSFSYIPPTGFLPLDPS